MKKINILVDGLYQDFEVSDDFKRVNGKDIDNVEVHPNVSYHVKSMEVFDRVLNPRQASTPPRVRHHENSSY